VPALRVGAVAVNEVLELTVTAPAPVDPNLTDVNPGTKFVPVTVTEFPPAVGPALGLRAVTVGSP
jgi:hypothetical protein